MMQEVLYGCDVMPSAIHITGSTLAGIQPEIGYEQSRLYTMPYGRQEDGSVKIGSLELLQSSEVLTLFNTSDPALRTGSVGEETASQINVEIPDGTFDLVIMNPPFTSNTKNYDAEEGVLNAAFAAFDSSEADQKEMAARLKKMAGDTCYHGHAGLGSAFAGLADRKVRSGGVVALVLPFTAINGPSWSKFRQQIATKYTDVSIISLADGDASGTDLSFSSDTGMAECLVIARKLSQAESVPTRADFTSLYSRPGNVIRSLELVKSIPSEYHVRRIEDGPYDGTQIQCGDELMGKILNGPLGQFDTGWGAARVTNGSLAHVAHGLTDGICWLAPQLAKFSLPVVQLYEVGERGLDSQMFISEAHKGPFVKAGPSSTADFPALWNHKASNETRLECSPDSQMNVKIGMEEKANQLWCTASRTHLSRGFRFNSQPLAVAFTERETIGGRAWPNIILNDNGFDFAFSIWGNSTLGLLAYWWHSSRQQDGRGEMTVNSMGSLPVLDFRTLSDAQLATAGAIFDEFRELDLMPAYLADADPNRSLLDRRVVCDLLGFDEDVYRGVRRLAQKWCAEPSVHGGKARPKSAKYVE